MFAYTVFGCLCLMIANGVFGVKADKVKSVSVMEGDSVTLHTHLTDLQDIHQLLWMFGPQGTRIAEMYYHHIIYEDVYKDRFLLNSQTGSLTISNIRITDSGLYRLKIRRFSYREYSDKIFRVTVNAVYGGLPEPVITSYCSQNPLLSLSSFNSKCVLLCSVVSVAHVSLSWYKGNSLLSSISVSDLNIRLSPHLEVEYQDTNTYRCVINNPITNHKRHVNITEHCQQCPSPQQLYLLLGVLSLLLLIIFGTCFYCCYPTRTKTPSDHLVNSSITEMHSIH